MLIPFRSDISLPCNWGYIHVPPSPSNSPFSDFRVPEKSPNKTPGESSYIVIYVMGFNGF